MSSLLVFHKVYRLEIQSVLLVFSTHSFVNYCPSTLLSGSPPPPLPPSQSKSTASVWLGALGGGVELLWSGDHIL
jgi:hypothetical protein